MANEKFSLVEKVYRDTIHLDPEVASLLIYLLVGSLISKDKEDVYKALRKVEEVLEADKAKRKEGEKR